MEELHKVPAESKQVEEKLICLGRLELVSKSDSCTWTNDSQLSLYKYFHFWELQSVFNDVWKFSKVCFSLVSFFNISSQLPDGQDLPLPPVILRELAEEPQNPTVCFYGHVDVQPAKKEDGWKTDPYTLTEINGVS